jgi:hypothetical protein
VLAGGDADEARPDDAGTPSLQNASDITDPGITARTVARKRGGFGAALGDILLPPGQSVAALVRAAAQKALADKGYAVVEAGSPLHGVALLGRDPTTVNSHVTHEGMAIFESDWKDLVQRGVEDLSQRIEERIKPAVAGR